MRGVAVAALWLVVSLRLGPEWYVDERLWQGASLVWLVFGVLAAVGWAVWDQHSAQPGRSLPMVWLSCLLGVLIYTLVWIGLLTQNLFTDLFPMLVLAAPLMIWLALFGLETWWVNRGQMRPVGDGRAWRVNLVVTLFPIVLCLLLAVIVLLPGARISEYRIPWNDSAIFSYFGQEIVAGRLPYTEIWDHKPPLIFYLNALGTLLGGGTSWGTWFLQVIFLWGTGVLAFLSLKKVFGKCPALIATGVGLASLALILERGNLTEQYGLLFQCAALSALVFAADRPALRGQALCLGALGGLAFLLKQNMIGLWVAIGLIWLVRWIQGQRIYGRAIVWMAGAFLAIQLVPVVYFAAHQTLGDYWEVAFAYNFLYSGTTIADKAASAIQAVSDFVTISPFYALGLLGWAVSIIGLATGRIAPGIGRLALLVTCIDLPIELLLISLSARNYRHYYMTAWPALLVLFAWGLALFERWMQKRPKMGRVLVGLALIPLLWGPVTLLVDQIPAGNEITVTQTARFIREQTPKTSSILVWSGEPEVYVVAGRSAPGRFFFMMPLFDPNYTSPERVSEFLADLTANPPAAWIDTGNPTTPLPFIDSEGVCHSPAGRLPQGMSAVYDFFCTHYRQAAVLSKDEWIVYTLIS